MLAPDFCVEPPASSKRAVSEQDADEADASLVCVLPGWQLLAGLDTVQALTLPVPAGSESARALVHFVREALVPR